MAKFDYMNFYGAADIEFVVHAKQFSKEQAIALFIHENMAGYTRDRLREPTADNIEQHHVRYYVREPFGCGLGSSDGCYSFCSEDSRGSFPVWTIDFAKLRQRKTS